MYFNSMHEFFPVMQKQDFDLILISFYDNGPGDFDRCDIMILSGMKGIDGRDWPRIASREAPFS